MYIYIVHLYYTAYSYCRGDYSPIPPYPPSLSGKGGKSSEMGGGASLRPPFRLIFLANHTQRAEPGLGLSSYM